MGLMLRSAPSDSRVVARSVITGSALRRPLLGVCDALVIMMADELDDCRDVVRYWGKFCEGYDCVFGSRFVRGGGPSTTRGSSGRLVSRAANLFIRLLFRIRLNDTTNAFKAYRKEVIDGCRPLIAPHFKLPLKAIVRGYSWTIIPITSRNRRSGRPKFRIREMGSSGRSERSRSETTNGTGTHQPTRRRALGRISL